MACTMSQCGMHTADAQNICAYALRWLFVDRMHLQYKSALECVWLPSGYSGFSSFLSVRGRKSLRPMLLLS